MHVKILQTSLKRAHNPKVVGSNPAPATKKNQGLTMKIVSPFA